MITLKAPHGLAEIKKAFGDFEYIEDPDRPGWIVQDQKWIRHSIVPVEVLGIQTVQCHYLLAKTIFAILASIHNLGYTPEVQGYAARHKMTDLSKSLSPHSWGIAFDVNPKLNSVNASSPQLHSNHEIVLAFKSAGFEWGGDWKSVKDWMHFQFCTGY